MPFSPITTPDEFMRSVRLGVTPESTHLDFKSTYAWRSRETKDLAPEFCRDLAQFANTQGGVLLIGVTEKAGAHGRKVADSINPVEEVDGFIQWAEQAIRNYLTPSTFTRSPITISTTAGPVLAFNVSASLHLVALWHKELKNGIEYLYRTDHGKQWMNPEEVEKHLMNRTRTSRLALIEVMRRIEESTKSRSHPGVELVPELMRLIDTNNRRLPAQLAVPARDLQPVLTAYGDLSLSLSSGTPSNLSVEIPYELVKASWVTGDFRVGVCLDVRLCAQKDRIAIYPLDEWQGQIRG